MKTRTLAALFAAAFATHTATTAATTAATAAEPVLLDPLVVTASRYARPVAETPANVTVLDARDLAPFSTLPLEDILARQAGVTLARTGGPGQQASVFLRGTPSDGTLVLVDGVKINGGAFGGANLQHLRGADIARIEVIRGPRSTLHGSEALGGVIAITTRRPDGDTGTQLRAGGGSNGRIDLHANATAGSEAGSASAGIGLSETGGEPLSDRTGITGAHENRSGTLNAHRRFGTHEAGFDVWASTGRTRYADCVYDDAFQCAAIAPLEQAFDNTAASAWGSFQAGDETRLHARIGHAQDWITQEQSADQARTRRLVAQVELHHAAGNHRLLGGIDAEREAVDATVYGSSLHADNDHEAVFLRDDWHQGRHQLSLGLRHTRYDSFGGEQTGEASYGLAFGESLFGWIATGRGFRAPDAIERFGFGGNPALSPETSASHEIGVRGQRGGHEITLAGFVQRIDGMIDYPAPDFVATNLARARITGTELGWRWRDARHRADAQLLLLDAVDDTTGARLSRRPAKQFSATLARRQGRLELDASVLAMDPRDNSAFDDVRLPGFAVADLGARWAVSPALDLSARIENAGDVRYALASGNIGDYRMPGRGFRLGIDWRP